MWFWQCNQDQRHVMNFDAPFKHAFFTLPGKTHKNYVHRLGMTKIMAILMPD